MAFWCSISQAIGNLKPQNLKPQPQVQIIDGMDTLTAALNILRLVALSKMPAGAFMKLGQQWFRVYVGFRV